METRTNSLKAIIIALLLVIVGLDQWNQYKFREVLSTECGMYVFVNYKYPDSDLWTSTQRIGPFKSEYFAYRVAADIKANTGVRDSVKVEILEDCRQY